MTRKNFLTLLIWTSITALTPYPRAAAAQANAPEQTTKTETVKLDVMYEGTPQHVVDIMLEMAKVKKTDFLYDLGCGDGRILVTAAQKFGCEVLGVDIDPLRVRQSRTNVEKANLQNLATIEKMDIFDLDLSKADVVALYLLPELNVRLIPQFETMKPGSRIVSHNFDMLGVEPEMTVTVDTPSHARSKIYLWTVPLNKVPPPAALAPDAQAKHIGPFKAALTHIYLRLSFKKAQTALVALAIAALCLAVFFRLLRKRLGVIKIKVAIERPYNLDTLELSSFVLVYFQ